MSRMLSLLLAGSALWLQGACGSADGRFSDADSNVTHFVALSILTDAAAAGALGAGTLEAVPGTVRKRYAKYIYS